MSNPRGEDTPLAKGSPTRLTGPVLAGVLPNQPAMVVERAAEVALTGGLELVLAFADVTRFPAAGDRDGHLAAQPIDPDGIDDDAAAISESLRSRIADQLNGSGVQWSFVALAGEPARSLGRYAASINASMIVVGTKEHGLGPKFEGLVTGSVALHLAHRQNCPVLMVPLGHHDASRDQ
ncbi:universal stress protein [Arthrobacter sp. MMS18-M83]|uniref:universal stress protein n=1 Tax=Arthrobacter sp. MMS18-M83 TaxID=2996261 RepID=UPI00227D47E1|nr:universal stress protein [Arthrobacter sp. MMS18-M83]WAH96364.1 universal stress protein [Arthrobacter sp. MMS18-M83]